MYFPSNTTFARPQAVRLLRTRRIKSGIKEDASRFAGFAAPARVSVARPMGPGIGIFARVMGPPNRQGHGARVAADRTLAVGVSLSRRMD
jgi:hypothetical protein